MAPYACIRYGRGWNKDSGSRVLGGRERSVSMRKAVGWIPVLALAVMPTLAEAIPDVAKKAKQSNVATYKVDGMS